jgi:hypothetical protein
MYVLNKRFNQTDAEALDSKPFEHKVKVIEGSTIFEVRDGEVVIQDKEFKKTVLPIDTVISCHTRPNISLFDRLVEAGVKVLNVGDSVKPRNLHSAVREGAETALYLDENLLLNSNNAVMDDIPLDILGQLI